MGWVLLNDTSTLECFIVSRIFVCTWTHTHTRTSSPIHIIAIHIIYSLDRVQNNLLCLMKKDIFFPLKSFSHRHKIESLSLLYLYFHGKCSDDLHSLDAPVQNVTTKTRQAMITESNHAHLLHIQIGK